LGRLAKNVSNIEQGGDKSRTAGRKKFGRFWRGGKKGKGGGWGVWGDKEKR